MERDCESELSKLNIEQNACIYHFGASVIHGQRSNILRLPWILSFKIMKRCCFNQTKKVKGVNNIQYTFYLNFFSQSYFRLPTFSFFKILEVFTSASIKVKPVKITATPIINNVHAFPLSNVTKIAIIATGIFIYPKLVAH